MGIWFSINRRHAGVKCCIPYSWETIRPEINLDVLEIYAQLTCSCRLYSFFSHHLLHTSKYGASNSRWTQTPVFNKVRTYYLICKNNHNGLFASWWHIF